MDCSRNQVGTVSADVTVCQIDPAFALATRSLSLTEALSYSALEWLIMMRQVRVARVLVPDSTDVVVIQRSNVIFNGKVRGQLGIHPPAVLSGPSPMPFAAPVLSPPLPMPMPMPAPAALPVAPG
jgi:hypothetical protein